MASLKDLGNSLQGFFSNAGKAVSSALPQVGQAVWNATPIGQVQQLQKLAPQVQSFIQKYPSPASYFQQQPIVSPLQQQQQPNMIQQAGYAFARSPVARAIESAQKFVESPQQVNLPQVPSQINFGVGPIKPLQMARDIINTPISYATNTGLDFAQNVGKTIRGDQLAKYNELKSPVTKLGYQIGGIAGNAPNLNISNKPQEILANVAGTIEGPLSVYSGGKVLGLGKEAAKQATKQTLKQLIIHGTKEGAKQGLLFGMLQGLQEGRDKTIPGQLVDAATYGLGGATLGGALGGGMAAGGHAFGSMVNIIKKFNPNFSPEQAIVEAKNFLKSELGNFVGVGKRKNEPVFYGDLRESLGLPRNGDYQTGAIDFGAEVGTKSKVELPKPESLQPMAKLPQVGDMAPPIKIYKEYGNTMPLEIPSDAKKSLTPEAYKVWDSMVTEKEVPISSLVKGENWQTNKVAGRKITEPIIINKDGLIFDGHNRVNQAIANGDTTIKAKIMPWRGEFESKMNELKYNNSLTSQVGDKTSLAPEVPSQQPRGFTTSVKESKNVISPVQEQVNAAYTPKPNTQLMGEAQALLQSGAKIDFKNVKNIDQKITATIQEAINQQSTNPELAANLFNNLSEQGTELGRGIQAFSLLNKMSPEAIALSAAGKIKKYNQTATRKIPELTGDQVALIGQKVDAIKKLADGSREKNIAINELSNTINQFIPSSIVDKALTVWKAGLLTSFRTTERNILSNTVHGAMEIAKDVPASVADIIMAAKTGKRTITPTIQGTGEFLSKKTAQQISDVVKLGYDASEDISKFDHKSINWGNNPLEQVLKKYTDIVFRSLGAQDKPFYNAAFKRSLYSQAGAEALNAGQKGSRQFIQNLVENPTELMVKNAVNDANIATFKTKNVASNVANTIKRELSKTEIGKLASEVVMPFTGVPSSVLGQISSYSPIGLLKGIASTGKVLAQDIPELQRQAAQEIGRGVIGTGIFGLGAYLASKGLITGQPKDATEQRQWDLENKPRNSIMIGGKWRSLNSIGPEAVVALAGAKLNEAMKSPEGSLGGYAGTLAKDYLDQSFVTGLQQPVNVITDPNRYGKAYVGNQLASIVPNIVKDASKAFDPLQRETNTIQDYFKQSIPGLRNTLIEKRDVLGNTMKQEPTGAGAFFDLFNSKTPVNNQAIQELSRLNAVGENATPGKAVATQNLGGVKTKLTPDQLNEFEKNVGPKITQALSDLFSTQYYKSLSDVDKSKLVDSTVAKVRKEYRDSFGTDGQKTSAKTIKIKAAPKMKKASVKKLSVKSVKVPKMKKTKVTNFKVAKPKKIKVTKSKPITYRSIMSKA